MSVLAVFSALLKGWLRSKTGVFFSFLFPAMLLLIFSTVFSGGGDGAFTLFIQNADQEQGIPTDLSVQFISALESTGALSIKYMSPEVDAATYARENPSFNYQYRILIIPEGFEEKALSRSMSVRIGVIIDTLSLVRDGYVPYISESDLEKEEKLLATVKDTIPAEVPVVTLLTNEGDAAAPVITGIIYSVANSFSNRLINADSVLAVGSEPLEERELHAVDYFLPGFVAAFIMTNGIVGATSTISEYRRNGQVKRLAATPLPKLSWILGNILQQTVLAFALTGVMIVLGWLIFGVTLIPNGYALALIFVGAVAFCSIGMVLGGIIKDVEAAAGAGNAIAFPMMFLSGSFWQIEMMPDYMQKIAQVLPLHYFHDGLLQIMVYDNPSRSCGAFLVLGAFALLFIAIAVKVTKWREF